MRIAVVEEKGIELYLRCQKTGIRIVVVAEALKINMSVINIVGIRTGGNVVQEDRCVKGVVQGILQVILRTQNNSIVNSYQIR